MAQAFPAGTSAAVEVVVRDRRAAPAVARALRQRRDLVADVSRPEDGPAGPKLAVTLRADPFTDAGLATVPAVRRIVTRASPSALVGGSPAEDLDTTSAAKRDNRLIVPLVLVVISLILVTLLRALALPGLLLVTVVVSVGAAFGLGALAFVGPFGFEAQDPTLPLIAFVFVAALGVDCNIFLAARIREETATHGTRAGTLRALVATGSVITSAGVVLAGTFTILALLPVVTLRQLGCVIAMGVLIDTLLVRSIILPALIFDADDRVWWPGGRPRALRPASSGVARGASGGRIDAPPVL